jgi:polyferredoxin
MVRRKINRFVWLRRSSQTSFLLLFLYAFLQAEYHPINETGHLVKLFFQMDPLILLSSWVSSHQVMSGLLFSLITVGVTIVIGRWFCGWVCPFGTLHNLLTSLRMRPAKEKLATGGYSRWQKTKYYLLAALLTAAICGINLTGWFDPFSFLYRSTALVAYPAVNDGAKSLFGWIYQTDPNIGSFKVTSASEPIYEFLRRTVLATTQPYFYGTFLIAVLFLAVLLLNLYRARFWCRYICPLGALLGVAGKDPLIQIKRNNDICNNCRACVIDCQGGANPDVADGWKPSECFYCWNCQSACPRNAISFTACVPGGRK